MCPGARRLGYVAALSTLSLTAVFALPAAGQRLAQAATGAPACFESADNGAIVAACTSLIAGGRNWTPDQFGLALQRRAQALANLGRLDDALGDLQEQVRRAYNPHRAHAAIGSIRYRQSRLDLAEASFRQALALNPSYADALSGLGQTLLALGRGGEAVASFQKALETLPRDPTVRTGLAQALAASGNRQEAIASLTEALRLDPQYRPALYLRAQFMVDAGQAASAQRDADALVAGSVGEERIRALTFRGRLRNTTRGYGAAVADCSEAAQLAEQLDVRDRALRAGPYVCRGLARSNDGDLKLAQSDYDQALRWVPDDGAVFAGRGYVAYLQGLSDQAIADLETALRLSPGSQDALRYLGLAYADKGELQKGLAAFERAITADPTDPWPLMLRATALAKAGDRASAIRDANEALRLAGTQDSDAHLARGAVDYFLDDLASAKRHMEDAIRLNSDNGQAYLSLSRLLLRQDRLDEAARALAAAQRIVPRDSALMHNRGLLALARRDYAGVVREISASLAINSAQSEGFVVRGQALEAQGLRDQAIADYRAAGTKLALDADGRRAQTIARTRLAVLVPTSPSGIPPSGRSDTPAPAGGERPPLPANRTDSAKATPHGVAGQQSFFCRVIDGAFDHTRR